MLTKGKFGAGKLQTSKVAFIASHHHHPKLICQLGFSCSLELASCLLAALCSDSPRVHTTSPGISHLV